MSNFNEEHIAYASIPHKSELRCIICEIDFTKIRDFSIKSSYHWQIFKCRLIIKTIQEVIASPILGTIGMIYVITTKELIENDKLKTRLQNLDVSYGKSQEITDDIYAMCLDYTIQYKIAPLWNKVGCYYVRGLQFYISMKEFDALKIKITINDTNAQFHFYTTKIKIPFIQLEDLHLLNSLVAEFLADNDGIINLIKYCPSVHILPSMKTGRVVSVYKKIPFHCPFKNYNQLRKYWIDMYGYYLPETEEDIMYYEVKFLANNSSSFIYPSICIATGPIQFCSFTNADNIILQFINDTCNTLNKICNKQLYMSHDNKEYNHDRFISSKIDTRKMNIQNYNHLLLPRDNKLIMDTIVSKDFNHGSDYIARYGCDISRHLCKSNKVITPLSMKRSPENVINQLRTCSKFMKFKKRKRTNDVSSLTDLLIVENKTHDVKMKTAKANENTIPSFKEKDLD